MTNLNLNRMTNMRHFVLSLLLCCWCGIAFSCDKAESAPKEESADSQ